MLSKIVIILSKYLSMKKILLAVVLMITTGLVFAQVKNPVKWSFESKKQGNGTYEVTFTAILEKGWHIYSQSTPDGGPLPTSFTFTKNPLITLTAKVSEKGKLETHFEKLFGVEVKQYADKVVFSQKLKVKANAKTSLSGEVEFMLCNDRECLPPRTVKFSVSLK